MNVDSASSASSGQQQPPSQRKERGAIAAQACDTCRSRKQKCDEQRPKCGLCQRMKLECRYREPQPTKKDKTLVEILNRLKSLEGKIDRIPVRQSPQSGANTLQTSPSSQFTDEQASYTAESVRTSQKSSPAGGIGRSQPYRHASAAHKMLTWPAITQMLLSIQPSSLSDLKSLEAQGSAFIVRLQKESPPLPLDVSLRSHSFEGMLTQLTRTAGGQRVTFPDLTYEVMTRLAQNYFDSFNLIYPVLDRQAFMSDTITKVNSEGFNGDMDTVLALLVFALGELAYEGQHGKPVSMENGKMSGLRGGTAERPPGLALFNEARRRMGFVLTDCDLENVQIFSLAALYYQSCSRHVEFWRLCVSASLACQVLITCNVIDWSTPRGDLVKRAFWHCAIMETGLNLELDLPLTGLVNLSEKVGLPDFNGNFCEQDHRCNEYSHFMAHFASQIALRRLCAQLHTATNDSMAAMDAPRQSHEDFRGPTAFELKQLASQLEQWRSLLPQNLRWNENDPAAFPAAAQPSGQFQQPIDPSLAPASQPPAGQPLFTADFMRDPIHYPYMVHRPFVYKALHYPEQMTQEDAEGVAECLKSCLKWPLSLSPPAQRKRLVPYIFCWSQNFLGILLILYMSRHSPVLRQIRSQLCGPRFEEDAEISVQCMMDWIRDLRATDPIARWCYGVLRGVYFVDD